MIDDQALIENDSPFTSILIITDYHAIKIMVIYLKFYSRSRVNKVYALEIPYHTLENKQTSQLEKLESMVELTS